MGELNTPLAPDRLIGSAYEPDGQLTRSVRAQPFCVLLFDEIEKAHPSVLNLLLQLLDDGRLTDASGSVADFTHTVVVMTSNLGAGVRRVGGFAEDTGAVKADVSRAIREFFPPELFNRIDRVVPFDPLSRRDAESIARKELGKLAARPGLAERNVFLRFSQAVVEQVVREAYKPEYGARALKRYIDREVGDLIAAHVTAEGSAELRLFYLHVTASGKLAIRAEALREAEIVTSPTELEELLSERGRALLERVPPALEFLRGVSEERLEEFGRRVSEELGRYRSGERERSSRVFSLDALRGHVSALLSRLEELVIADEALQEQERAKKRAAQSEIGAEDYRATGEAYHRQHAYERVASEWADSRYRQEDPHPKSSSPRPLALLHDLVEARFLRRALSDAHDPEEHAVLIELVRLGELSERRRFSGGNPGLLEWLAPAYARARGELERVAVTFADGRLESVRTVEALEALLHERAQSLSLLLLGPSVRSFFAGENGCHIRRTATFGPEIVRVRVLPAADPAEHLRSHDQRRREFVRALESGALLPENPEGLLPIIRSLRLNLEPGKAVSAAVEDYRLGYVAERRVRALADLLQEPWLLSAGATEA
jgi:ATP-dependent Clp protease ATP-binding subunit ClpA/ATP-dependent Clp protease ATP-binding subunit ClpC